MRRLALIGALMTLAAGAARAQPPLPFGPPPAAPNPAAVAAAADFMAKNKDAPGVKTLPDGLQYKIIASGPAGGPSPKEGDAIKVHYEGALITGEVFDSSFKRNRPLLAPLQDLVPGWMEALPLMHPGDEWMLYIPPSLGYGAETNGPIPGSSVLVFRLKLLGMLSAD